MNMWASAKAFTHDDLRKAFDDYAEAHGHELARSALQRSTGAREVSAVPDVRILNGMVELVGGFSFVGRSAPCPSPIPVQNLVDIHKSLAAIRAKSFAVRGH
jgi:hypothetical protein